MGTSLVFALLLKPVYEWIKNRWTTLIQLLILLNLYILLDLPVIYKSAESKAVVWLVVLVVLIVSNLFTIFIYSVFQDVRALTKLSNRDGLTQLYNNNKFRTDIELLSKHGKQYTILIIDIDHFKKVNDTYGHLVGDDVIKKTSDILKKVSDNKYLFYRFGGDEFVTIINDVDGEQAKLLAFKIQEELKKLKVYLEDLSYITVTVSIGFAKRKEQEPLIKTFERADKALYKAKESGCNRVEIEYECPIFQESEQEPEELLNILSEE
ncbi:GGDEF domain-containing protein [Aerococcaceae bacterium WGS1372]